ncbi:MAG: pilus assembly protein CpaE [Pirellulaceae bacterium]|nr:pilus assembly protein CpaE [Pirellulaceae bacterium]
MSNVLRLALVDPRDETREKLKSMLIGMDLVWLEAECSRYEFFGDVVSQTTPDVGVICMDSSPEKAIALIERLRSASPDCVLIALSQSTDGPTILKALRAGAKEFLTLPVNVDELLSTLHRILEAKFGTGDSRIRACKMIAVAGATGGVGCTSIAVNIGCNLASNPENSVALVDLDLALGDADVFLDSIPDYSLLDVTENVSRLDFQLLRKSLTKHSSGLYLLPRPVQLQDLSAINPESLRKVIGLLRASFTHVVIDTSKSFSEVDLAAMELVNEVALIVQLDLPCLRNMVRLLMSFQEMDNIRDKVKVVVNRMGLESGQISLKKARESIGRDVYHQIPNDYRTMVEMRNNGVPLIEQAPRAPITQSIMQLTDMLVGNVVGDESESGEGGADKSVASSARWLNFFQGKNPKVKAKS